MSRAAPPLRVARVGDQVIPEGNLALEIPGSQVGEGATVQVEAVAVGRSVVEWTPFLAGGGFELLLKPVHEAPVVAQPEAAAVKGVVAVEQSGHRCLRRDGFEGGMGIDHPRRRIKTEVGNAGHADVAVVAANVMDQPLNGVPGVGALVDGTRVGLCVQVRADVNELTLRGESTANILQNENELLVYVGVGQVTRPSSGVDGVGLQVVRGSLEQNRILGSGCCVLGGVNQREKLHAVPHGDAVFVLRVPCCERIRLCRCVIGRGTEEEWADQDQRG